MSPEVTAAIIAAGVGILTLIGTLAAQYLGHRATNRDTQQALAEQRTQLDRTFAEQHRQLDKTLAEQRTRTLNERFAMAAEQLGSDKPAVRLAGVYAMAGLADDWEENRQTCVDVLCAYLHMPYESNPGQDAPEPQRLAFQAMREVRHTVIRVITAHLKEYAATPWQDLNFDFTGVVFDGGDFSSAQFSGRGMVDFRGAQFSGGAVDFDGARFSGGVVDFSGAEFSGGAVYFHSVACSGGAVIFSRAEFSGGEVDFSHAWFSGGVDFDGARFSGGTVNFGQTLFSGSVVDFSRAEFSGSVVDFSRARFSGGTVNFSRAEFSGGAVDFSQTMFSGGEVDFSRARFSGGTVDFSDASDWSFPPAFSWTDTPPAGVRLPNKEGPDQK